MDLRDDGSVLLISCYELGHQPLGIALPVGFLERAGYSPASMDIAVEKFDANKAARAQFIGISVPMHTAPGATAGSPSSVMGSDRMNKF